MVEHSLCMRGARGSIPRISILIFLKNFIPYIYCYSVFLLLFFILSKKLFIYKKTTTAGFEPTLPKGNCLAGNRLNHSATLSYTILEILLTHYYIYYYYSTMKFFEKKILSKRQWQDLNLRIQRIIDFKSIALDHSATLSSLYKLFLFYSFRFFYVYISFFIITFFCLPLFSMSLILLLLCLSSFLFFLSLMFLPFPFIQ